MTSMAPTRGGSLFLNYDVFGYRPPTVCAFFRTKQSLLFTDSCLCSNNLHTSRARSQKPHAHRRGNSASSKLQILNNEFMARGRKPIPTALHELNGSYDKDPQRRRTQEPVAPNETPTVPDSLDEYGLCEWHHITTLLEQMNLLSSADKAALEIYCQTFSEWRKAVDMCNKYGAWTVYKDKDGHILTRRNEFDRVRERSSESLRRWLTEFGLTPSSRSRVEINKPETGDELDRFFSGTFTN